MKRETGYYWVKPLSSWIIAYYNAQADGWIVPDNWYRDDDLVAIDERRIVRDDTPSAHKLGYTPDQL